MRDQGGTVWDSMLIGGELSGPELVVVAVGHVMQ